MKKGFLFLSVFFILVFSGFVISEKSEPDKEPRILGVFDRDSVLITMPGAKAALDSIAYFAYINTENRVYCDSTIAARTLQYKHDSTKYSPAMRRKFHTEIDHLRHCSDSIQTFGVERLAEMEFRLLNPYHKRIDYAAKNLAVKKHYAYVLDTYGPFPEPEAGEPNFKMRCVTRELAMEIASMK